MPTLPAKGSLPAGSLRVATFKARGGGDSEGDPLARGEHGREPRSDHDASTRALEALLVARGAFGPAADAARRARDAAVSRVAAAAERVGAELHAFGSHRLDVAGAGGDVDALAVGPRHLGREAFVATLTEALARDGGAPFESRFIAGAFVPVLKLDVGVEARGDGVPTARGVNVDVSYARCPEASRGPLPTPDQLLRLHAAPLDRASARSLTGSVDTEALLARVEAEGSERAAAFRALLGAVKTWARARGIYGHAYGYMGGLSWAVMAGWVLERGGRRGERRGAEPRGSGALLERFFTTYADWPWPRPVALTKGGSKFPPSGKRDWMPVVTPAPPYCNSARNVSRSTAQALRRELTRGRELAARARAAQTAGDATAAWELLFEPIDPATAHPARLVLTAEAREDRGRIAAGGWVFGHLMALIFAIEEERAMFVRPFPGDRAGPFVLGIARGGPEGIELVSSRPRGTLAEAVRRFVDDFHAWPERPAGAELFAEIVPRDRA